MHTTRAAVAHAVPRVWQQASRECVLATLCTLSGSDYPTARELFALEHGRAWGDCNDIYSGRAHLMPFVTKYFPHLAAQLPVDFFMVKVQSGLQEGDGALGVLTPYGDIYSGHLAHMVALINGHVYDSATNSVQPLEHFAQSLSLRGGTIVAHHKVLRTT